MKKACDPKNPNLSVNHHRTSASPISRPITISIRGFISTPPKRFPRIQIQAFQNLFTLLPVE